MPKNNESLNKELYSLLKTRGFDPIPKDATGETSPVPDDADVFKFTFKHDNQVKGTAYATIDGNNTLTVYYDDEVVSEEVGGVDDVNMSWTNFLKYLKMWAQRRQMGFDLENKDHLHSDMAQRDYVKKQEVAESKKKLMNKGTTMPNISEGYYAMGKNSSYNDNIPTVKIILQHSRQIQEGEQRYRNVARIYLENTQGERFLAPTVKPGIAQVYARHLAEGGSVNDERWNHIKSLCEEYSKMAGFVRAVRGNQFNESAQKLVEAGLNHYVSLRETLGKMRGNRGYNSYFESWTPTLMETDGDETSINELFVQETLDPRIESVMPILSKLSKNLSEVKEVKELEEWANGLLEAPGAETLAHNQSTAKSNLKAFDLEEDSVNEGWFADTLKSVGKAVLDRLAPNDKQLLLQLQKDMGVPTTAQHGKPSMARMMSDEEVQKLIAAARKVNAGRNSSLSEEEVEESGLQAYLGNKKYGKDGMDSLRKAGREGASKEKMAKIRAKYDKLDEEGMDEGLAALSKKLGQIEEDLGPEQKRVGQLGPTEKVKKNSGARGKLVGANESVEQGVVEGSTNKTLFVIYYKTGKGFDAGTGDVGILASNEQKAKEKFAKKYPHFIVTKIVEGMKYVLVDYRGNYFKGMDKFGRNLSTRNPEEAEIFNLERDAKDIALWTRNRFKAIPWSGQQGVAEGSTSKEKQKTPYRDINSPEYKAAAEKQKKKMANDQAAEPGKKLLDKIKKKGVAEGLAPGQAAWKKEMMEKGAVRFKRDQHGGGAVDRIVAYDKDGKVVGGFNRKGVAEANVSKYQDLGATNATTHFLKNVTTGEIISPHRSRADADEALQAATNKNKEGHKFTIVRARKQGVAEGKKNLYHVVDKNGIKYRYSSFYDATNDSHPAGSKLYKNGIHAGTFTLTSHGTVLKRPDGSNWTHYWPYTGDDPNMKYDMKEQGVAEGIFGNFFNKKPNQQPHSGPAISSQFDSVDPYTILGISRGANTEEIKQAFRKLASMFHPDKPTGDSQKFQKINMAYRNLMGRLEESSLNLSADIYEAMFPDSPVGDTLRRAKKRMSDRDTKIAAAAAPVVGALGGAYGSMGLAGTGIANMAGGGIVWAPAVGIGALTGAAIGLGGFLTYKALNWLAQKVFGTKEEAIQFAKAHLAAAKNGNPNFIFQGKTYPVKVKSPEDATKLMNKILELEWKVSESVDITNESNLSSRQEKLDMNKNKKQGVAEGQEDLDALKKLMGK